MGIEDFPVTPPEPESIELSEEEKDRISGKKDSFLDQRAIYFPRLYLNKLLSGIVITDRNDVEGIANALITRHNELRNIEDADVSPERSVEDMGTRSHSIEDYILKYGLNETALELIRVWTTESLRVSESDGTMRAKIIHNLRLMDFYRAGGKNEEALELATDAYKSALKEKDEDLIRGILSVYPEFKDEITLEE